MSGVGGTGLVGLVTVLAGRAGATESVASVTLFPKTFTLSLQRSPSIRSRRAFGFEKAMEHTRANALPVQFVYARLSFVHRSQTQCSDVACRRFRAVCQGLARDG